MFNSSFNISHQTLSNNTDIGGKCILKILLLSKFFFLTFLGQVQNLEKKNIIKCNNKKKKAKVLNFLYYDMHFLINLKLMFKVNY